MLIPRTLWRVDTNHSRWDPSPHYMARPGQNPTLAMFTLENREKKQIHWKNLKTTYYDHQIHPYLFVWKVSETIFIRILAHPPHIEKHSHAMHRILKPNWYSASGCTRGISGSFGCHENVVPNLEVQLALFVWVQPWWLIQILGYPCRHAEI